LEIEKMAVNKFIGIGNLGRDPETRYMGDGKAVTNFSIAISEKYKDKTSGEWREVTEWVNVVLFGRLAEVAAEYLGKGSKVFVEGKLKTEKYTDKTTGVEKYTTKVVCEKMEMLSPKGEGKPAASKPQAQPEPEHDDDIPF
jgi:single-strand DNA-binding protein